MGTSFSVTYATIFMIWLETPIIDHFRKHIVLYKRYIDDNLLIWSGSPVQLCLFRAMFGTANINIKLEWQGTPLDVDATDPAMLVPYKIYLYGTNIFIKFICGLIDVRVDSAARPEIRC